MLLYFGWKRLYSLFFFFWLRYLLYLRILLNFKNVGPSSQQGHGSHVHVTGEPTARPGLPGSQSIQTSGQPWEVPVGRYKQPPPQPLTHKEAPQLSLGGDYIYMCFRVLGVGVSLVGWGVW